MARCSYSESTDRMKQTGCERETRGNGDRDITITKLEGDADRKTGEDVGGGGHYD